MVGTAGTVAPGAAARHDGRPGGPDDLDALTREVLRASAECEASLHELQARLRRAARVVQQRRLRRALAERAQEAPPASTPRPRRAFEEELVRANLELARRLSHRYRRRGESAEDLEQVATLALVAAARRYEPDRSIPFAGYATPCILGELKRHFRDRSWGMRVPRALSELYLAVRTARDEMLAATGTAPTIPQLAERLECSTEEVLEAMDAGRNFRPESIDGLGEAQSRRLPSADSDEDRILDRHRLGELLPHLQPDERRMLQLRFVDGRTQASIATELGVSQMHVSRTLDRVLRRLRHQMEET